MSTDQRFFQALAGLTLGEAAEECGIDPRTLSKFATGGEITPAIRARIEAWMIAREARAAFAVVRRSDGLWWATLPPGVIDGGIDVGAVAGATPEECVDRACALLRRRYEENTG